MKAFKLTSNKIAIVAAVLILAALSFTLFACNSDRTKPQDTSTYYDIIAELNDGVLNVTQEILYVAPEDENRIVLNVYANAFSSTNSAIDILSLQINRKTVDYEIYGAKNTLMKLPCSLKKGHTASISLKYRVTLPKSDTRLGITANGISNLACFYPVIARYENGWREDAYCDIGDPFYHDIASFYVSLTVDESLQVASSGKILEVNPTGKSKKTIEIEAENIRDFAMAVGKAYVLSDVTEIDGRKVALNYFYFEDPYPQQTLKHIENSLATFSKIYGAYPYDVFTVAQSNLSGAGGMEYGTFVTVSKIMSRDEYFDVITHETAHQWWYNVVGSDQINAPWLDEGLTEFSTAYFHYLSDDKAKYNAEMASMRKSYSAFYSHENLGFSGKMNRPLSSYVTDGEYVAVTYFKGALLFDALHSLTGDAKFQSALKRYFDENAFGIATQASLINAFKAEGFDISKLINRWTETSAII